MYLICKKGGKTVSTYYTMKWTLRKFFLLKIVLKRNFFGGEQQDIDWQVLKVFDFESSHFSFDDVS